MRNRSRSSDPELNSAGAESPLREPPRDFRELTELGSSSVEHALGYFGDEPCVLFGYCPGAEEVVWRDSHTSGFAAGGWRTFLWEIAPLAARHGVDLGSANRLGTHVLFMDRGRGALYAAPRESAERFLSLLYGVPLPKRPCLCSRTGCALCPVRDCLHAGVASGSASADRPTGEGPARGQATREIRRRGGKREEILIHNNGHLKKGWQ
jgi:hypothetical protein